MSSQESATSGSVSSSNRNRQLQALPPIRTVLGEQLALPTLPSSHSPHSASSRGSAYASSWEVRDREDVWQKSGSSSSGSKSGGSQRPPSRTRASTVSSHYLSPHPEVESSPPPSLGSAHSLPPSPFPFSPGSSHAQGDVAGNVHPHLPPWAHPILPNSAPPYSYNVLRPSPSGELITGPSVSRARGKNPSRTGSSTAQKDQATSSTSTNPEDAMNARKHVCPVCQKRFNRPSSLKTHQSVHTGSRPFACPHPGCSKTFSVASNMRRHLRKHGDYDTPPEPDHGHDSLGSSDELDMEVEEEPTPEPVPSGLPVPGAYFEWTSTPGPTTEDASMSDAHQYS